MLEPVVTAPIESENLSENLSEKNLSETQAESENLSEKNLSETRSMALSVPVAMPVAVPVAASVSEPDGFAAQRARKNALALMPLPTHNNSLMSIVMPTLGQTQREAIVDLLLLGMHYDKRINLVESDFLAAEVNAIGWDEFSSPDIYLQRSIPVIRQACQSEDRQRRLLRDIGSRLAEVEVMKYAIERFSSLLALGGAVIIQTPLLDQVMETFFAEL
jgi:hypothetical protein